MDVRSPNTLMKSGTPGEPKAREGGTYQLRVIHFDWASECGKVRYPSQRNDDVGWRALQNDLTKPRHDVEIVQVW
jgi:hypothetical protein